MSGKPPSAEGPIRYDGGETHSMGVFPRRAESVSDARAWLTSFLHQQAVPVPVSEDAVLVLSELVTNALRHGLGEIVAHSSLTEAGVLNFSVTDAGRELPVLRVADADRVGGVGLQIVDSLTSQWGIAPFPGGKTVWATWMGIPDD